MKYLFRMQYQDSEEGLGLRIILFTIINMFVGYHSVKGEHLNLGLGLGPMEISLTFHRWTNWLP